MEAKETVRRRVVVHTPFEVGKRPKQPTRASVSKGNEWMLNWPPNPLPPCPICMGRLTVNWAERFGSELFTCSVCSIVASIDWVEGERSRQAEVDLHLKLKPGLADRVHNTEEDMAKKTKKSGRRVSVKSAKGRRLLGKTTGKGIAETWTAAFARGTKSKWTDDQISRFMKAEFPGRSSAIFESKGVKMVRSRFNSGALLGQKGKPATRSVALGKNGKPEPRKSAPAKKTSKRKVVVRRRVVRK